MADTETAIESAYSAFNKRDIDGVFALTTEHVSWPRPAARMPECKTPPG